MTINLTELERLAHETSRHCDVTCNWCFMSRSVTPDAVLALIRCAKAAKEWVDKGDNVARRDAIEDAVAEIEL